MKQSIVIISVVMGVSLVASAQDQYQNQGIGLGRLFTTPAERAKLDLARKQGIAPAVDASADPSDMEPKLATLDGYVLRENGKMTTWINQVPTQETEHGNSMRVSQNPGHAPLISVRTDAGKSVKVNVGETVDLQTGAVTKLLDTP